MEELGDLIRFRIDARQVRTLVEVTVDAGESQISEFVRAAVKAGNDMLEVEYGQRRIALMKLAILATVISAISHRGANRAVHLYDTLAIWRACRRNTATNLFART